jgi:hypothetical protein
MAAWISAIAASLALLATAATLLISVRDRHRMQADQVSVHFAVVTKQPFPRYAVLLYNLSGLPVKTVDLQVVFNGHEVGIVKRLASVPPQSEATTQPQSDRWIDQQVKALIASGVESVEGAEIRMTFTDARGRRWCRDHSGVLHSVHARSLAIQARVRGS